MDISSLYNMNSDVIKDTIRSQQASKLTTTETKNPGSFSGILNTALENIRTTNSYLSDAENEELKFALGETENTHDLLIAQTKAATALQYTVAIRDKFLESYKELMNMQI